MTVRSILVLLARKFAKVVFRVILSQWNIVGIDLWADFGSLWLVHTSGDLNAKGRPLQCKSGVLKVKEMERDTKTLYEGRMAQALKDWSAMERCFGCREPGPTTNQADVYPFMGLMLHECLL
jgi:hypothetical protein